MDLAKAGDATRGSSLNLYKFTYLKRFMSKSLKQNHISKEFSDAMINVENQRMTMNVVSNLN